MRRGRKLPAAEVVPAVEAYVTIVLTQDQDDPLGSQSRENRSCSADLGIQTHDAETTRAAFVAHTIDAAEELTAMLTAQIGRPVIGAGSAASGRSPA